MGRAVVWLPDKSLDDIWNEAEAVGVVCKIPDVWPLLPPDHPWRYAQCERKTAYLYLETALYKATGRMRQSSVRLKVYACPFACEFHICRFRAPITNERDIK